MASYFNNAQVNKKLKQWDLTTMKEMYEFYISHNCSSNDKQYHFRFCNKRTHSQNGSYHDPVIKHSDLMTTSSFIKNHDR